MLNQALFDPKVARFIKENQNKDIPALILKGSPFEEITVQELAVQIKGLKVAKKKFPEFYGTEGIIYPPKLNLEQTSSEVTARYKASLVDGRKAIDLTGGMGIDSYFLSKRFEELTYCEINEELAGIASHNFEVLKANNITVKPKNGLEILKETSEKFDWLYADPARRDEHGGKVFKLEDCEPNIPANLGMIFQHTENVMIKTSPILDISAGITELKNVKEIHIVAIGNEVKELLWMLQKDFKDEPAIKTVNFEKNGVQEFSGVKTVDIEKPIFGDPEVYLYEPNAAIMKSGMYNRLAIQTDTKKLNPNSHLYTSKALKSFPGRSFEIIDIKQYKDSDIKRYFKGKNANVTTRNFPESVEQIRKKFKIKDGGEDYIFFTTNPDEQKIVIVCKKV
ncbi:class I SAM-dependent methyltransferase [Gramella jeungdoensis]|uniref:Class I SAM-dependent methyltransferase n=1 Tax=Gramella jeungdoensis TaxID=708091 RepID=A0ABT0Z3S3_9FLAO|nr:class I SAM-dependent methyltransferase [Gramella jeungdoensis]MCM8570055.1 class I SAM-dependent methyltransferase [Gramella jeungdoensis]